MKLMSLLSALSLILFAGSWAAGQTPRGNPKAGQTIYEQHCLRCHGEKLDGHGPDAQYLIVPPTNLQSGLIRHKTDWELLITISDGVLFSPMHGFRGKLTDQQLLDVLAYIRMISPPEFVS